MVSVSPTTTVSTAGNSSEEEIVVSSLFTRGFHNSQVMSQARFWGIFSHLERFLFSTCRQTVLSPKTKDAREGLKSETCAVSGLRTETV